MNYGILFEKVEDKDFPSGYFYAQIPSLGLTTHGQGLEGARQAALKRAGFVVRRQSGSHVSESITTPRFSGK
jgi:hypothetical protein